MSGDVLALVDDDLLFLSTLALNLEDAGYKTLRFDRGQAALDHFAADEHAGVAALVLDWQMPGMDGMELLLRLRDAGVTAPAIFLTSLTQPIYEERALDQGAVDFVDKTRSFSVILKRLKLAIGGVKALPPNGVAVASTGPLELDLKSHRASWNEDQVALTLTEFNVVRLLVERAGRDVSYREIYDRVRGEGFIAGFGEDGFRSNVRTLVKRIRQKFRDLDPEFDQLENYPGFGYRWRAEP